MKKESIFKTLELGYNLAKANFKLRNEGSYLGVLWYLLEPLLLFLIIILVRNNISGGEIPDYPIYLLIGLIMFNFFRNSTVLATNSIRNNGSLIKSIKIEKEAFVISAVTQFIFSHFFELIVLSIFMIFYKISVINLLLYLPILFFFLIFTLGVSFILATLGVFINDINNIWNVFTRVLWFATPIFYLLKPNTLIYKINLFNPLSYFINLSRRIILYRTPPGWQEPLILITLSLFLLIVGFNLFKKYEGKFAEEL